MLIRNFWETHPDPEWALETLYDYSHNICEEMDKNVLGKAIDFPDNKWCA